jgi:hypothetical protein
MIPTMTFDLTSAFAALGWMGTVCTIAAFAALVGAIVRDRRARPVVDVAEMPVAEELRHAA